MVLRVGVEERRKGSATLVSDLVVNEAHQRLIPDRPSYTYTNESGVMLTLYS